MRGEYEGRGLSVDWPVPGRYAAVSGFGYCLVWARFQISCIRIVQDLEISINRCLRQSVLLHVEL